MQKRCGREKAATPRATFSPFRLCRKDGARISIAFTIVPFHDDHGSMIEIAALMRDVRVRFEEIKALRRQLAASAAAPSEAVPKTEYASTCCECRGHDELQIVFESRTQTGITTGAVTVVPAYDGAAAWTHQVQPAHRISSEPIIVVVSRCVIAVHVAPAVPDFDRRSSTGGSYAQSAGASCRDAKH